MGRSGEAQRVWTARKHPAVCTQRVLVGVIVHTQAGSSTGSHSEMHLPAFSRGNAAAQAGEHPQYS